MEVATISQVRKGAAGWSRESSTMITRTLRGCNAMTEGEMTAGARGVVGWKKRAG